MCYVCLCGWVLMPNRNRHSLGGTLLNIKNDTWDVVGAAEVIGCSPNTLNSWRSRQKGPKYIRIAGRIRYLKTDVQEWLENEIAAA